MNNEFTAQFPDAPRAHCPLGSP